MIKVTICTTDNILRKKLELGITQQMNSNHIGFHLCEVQQNKDIPDDSFLILGDSDALYDYTKKMMMIVVLNDHQHDEALARLAICAFIAKEDVDTQLSNVLLKWVDYFFDNYHFSIDEVHEFMLPEVNYFEILNLTKIQVHTDDCTFKCELPFQYSTFSMLLPKNFLIVGTEYIINLDKVKAFEDGKAIMKDGKIIPSIIMKKVEERTHRFDLANSQDKIAIGDKYNKAKIHKAVLMTGAIGLAVSGTLIYMLLQGNFSIGLSSLIGLLVFSMLFLPLYTANLGSSGDYYELQENGIYYYSESSMLKKAKWSQAVLKHDEQSQMKFIPYEDVAYIRVGTRATANMMSSMFLDFNNKNYLLKLKFETTTDTLEFEEIPTCADLFAMAKLRLDIACLLNRLTLLGKKVESGEGILMALNDPNADLQQYMNKRNKEDI